MNIIELKDKKDKLKMIKHYKDKLKNKSLMSSKVLDHLINDKCLSKETIDYFNVGATTRWIMKDDKWIELNCYVLFCSLNPFSYEIKVIPNDEFDITSLSRSYIYSARLNYFDNKKIKVRNRNSSTLYNINLTNKVIISENYMDMLSVHEIKKKEKDFTSACLNSNCNISKLTNDIVATDIAREKTYYIVFSNKPTSISNANKLYESLNELNFNVKNITEDVFGKTFKKYNNCNHILTEDKKKLQRRIYRFAK